MKLLEFPHSHFCEKARWALDYKDVSFQPVAVLPGIHLITVRKYAPKSSVPVLLTGEEAIQGSGEIIDYLDSNYPDFPLTPEDSYDRKMCLDIEEDMERRLGENIRQILYHRLLYYPDFLRSCFTHGLPEYKKFAFRLLYPALRSKMYKRYVVSDEKVKEARRQFDGAMGDIKKILGRGQYLVGGQFTRVDMSVASMLSLLVLPEEHPFPWEEVPDPQLNSFYKQYEDHSVCGWVRNIYRYHRLRKAKVLQ